MAFSEAAVSGGDEEDPQTGELISFPFLYGIREKVGAELFDRLDELDTVTRNHSIAVALLAHKLIGLRFIDEQMQEDFLIAALFHDIGKIGLNSCVTSNGPLSRSDMNRVRQHPVRSHQILRHHRQFGAAEIALRHHQFQSDSYPDTEDEDPTEELIGRTRARICSNVPVLLMNIDEYRHLAGFLAIIDQFHAMTDPSRRYQWHVAPEDAATRLGDSAFFSDNSAYQAVISALSLPN